MNDRFKFRAWDKKGKKMLLSFGDQQGSRDSLYADEWDTFLYALGNISEPGAKSDGDRNYILMQSTGFRDKNGELIFEGDILGTYDPEDKSKCEVVWHDGSFKKRYKEDKENGIESFMALFDESDKEIWVIKGNIYQNPEYIQ